MTTDVIITIFNKEPISQPWYWNPHAGQQLHKTRHHCEPPKWKWDFGTGKTPAESFLVHCSFSASELNGADGRLSILLASGRLRNSFKLNCALSPAVTFKTYKWFYCTTDWLFLPFLWLAITICWQSPPQRLLPWNDFRFSGSGRRM